MKQTTDLLPCPFCSSAPRFTSERDIADGFDHSFSVFCEECGISLTDEYESDVAERWNRRSTSFNCAARQQGTAGGNDPADCDWPFCGCDPAANKILLAVEYAEEKHKAEINAAREDLSDAEQMLRMELPDAEYSHENIPFWERITQFLQMRDEHVFTGEADDDERLASAAMILESLVIQNPDTLSGGVWNGFIGRALKEAREEQEGREDLKELEDHEDYLAGRK